MKVDARSKETGKTQEKRKEKIEPIVIEEKKCVHKKTIALTG